MKPFAGLEGDKGKKDGQLLQSRFFSPMGIAFGSKVCLVGDTNCVRSISLQSPSLLENATQLSSLSTSGKVC